MDNITFENKILKKIQSLLKSYEKSFSERNISYAVQIKRDKDAYGNYFSEVEILFNKNEKFLDIIEFFIYRDGVVYLDEENLAKELILDFEGILAF